MIKNFFAAFVLAHLCFSLSAQWRKIDVPFTNPLVLSPVDSNTLWCFNFSDPKIARTTDGGANWSLHDIPNAEGFLLSYLISAIDSSRAWVAFNHYGSGINYVYKTLDGGQSWEEHTPQLNNFHRIVFQKFYTIDKGMVITTNSSGSVVAYRTTNGGQNWTSKTLLINGSLLGTATYGDKNVWFYTGSGEIWRTNDGGENWSKFQTSLVADAYGLAMEFADSLNGLAFKDKYFNQLYRTTDGGASWQEVGPPNDPPGPGAFVWGLTKIPNVPQAWIVGYNEGTVYTLDDGNTWITESNYPDYDFRQPAFLNPRQGWGAANNVPAVFKWEAAVDSTLKGCLDFIGPLSGTLRRSECDQIWFQGNIRVDIADDPGIHLRVQLVYPDNTVPSTQRQIFNNISTGCPDCAFHFVPDAGQTTTGSLYFEMPVQYAFDTSQTVLCTVSPTQCAEDSSVTFAFHTGYFANWFHPECFGFDTSDCAIQLLTNVCGIDTNAYLIYHSVDGGPLVPGDRYEKNPSYREKIRFYIYAWGNIENSTCYEWIDTLYTCGVSAIPETPASNAALRISPNPAGGAFRVDCDNLPESQGNIIRVKNAAGVLVGSRHFPQGQTSLVMEGHNLPNGFYVVELWSDDQLLAYEKLVLVKNN